MLWLLCCCRVVVYVEVDNVPIFWWYLILWKFVLVSPESKHSYTNSNSTSSSTPTGSVSATRAAYKYQITGASEPNLNSVRTCACCGMSWHVVACRGMLWHVVACCGMLWHVVACFGVLLYVFVRVFTYCGCVCVCVYVCVCVCVCVCAWWYTASLVPPHRKFWEVEGVCARVCEHNFVFRQWKNIFGVLQIWPGKTL